MPRSVDESTLLKFVWSTRLLVYRSVHHIFPFNLAYSRCVSRSDYWRTPAVILPQDSDTSSTHSTPFHFAQGKLFVAYPLCQEALMSPHCLNLYGRPVCSFIAPHGHGSLRPTFPPETDRPFVDCAATSEGR